MSEQPFLPKFSDSRDIDTFVEKLEAFERGDINAEQFRAFRLLRGVYGQRQTDVQMFRIKIPMGLLGPEQLRVIADITTRLESGRPLRSNLSNKSVMVISFVLHTQRPATLLVGC